MFVYLSIVLFCFRFCFVFFVFFSKSLGFCFMTSQLCTITNNHQLPLVAASHAFFKEHSLLVPVGEFH